MGDLIRIDKLNLHDHSEISSEDYCYFILEYTPGKGYDHSTANNLISNLKKKPSSMNVQEKYYKKKAIRVASSMLRDAINTKWLQNATLVPVPSSKIVGHDDYDDRMEQVCLGIGSGLDVRSLVKQNRSMHSSHSSGSRGRITRQELLGVYYIDEDITDPAPTSIGIFDDVLTKGTHYRAMHKVLSERFPDARICGIFIARVVHDAP